LTFEANDLDGLLKEALVKVRDQIRTADRVIFLMQEGRQFAIKAAHGAVPGVSCPWRRSVAPFCVGCAAQAVPSSCPMP
jgi:hypothetical protein